MAISLGGLTVNNPMQQKTGGFTAGYSGNAQSNTIMNQSIANQGNVLKSVANPKAAPNPVAQGQSQVNANNAFISQQQAAANQQAQMLKEIQAEMQAMAPPVAQTLNVNAIKAAAQKASNSQVNPLYTQQLHEYLQNEAANEQAQRQQNTLNLQGYQQELANTLGQNQLTTQNAAQQNALQQANINAESSNYQLNSGNAETAKINALQQGLGQGNLSGSGMGAQQLWQAENQKVISDAQQQGGFQYNRDVANQATNMTFEQMNLSSGYAKKQETSQEAQSNFNLNNYIRQYAQSQTQYENALVQWKQQALGAAQQNYIANNLSGQIQNIANPGVRGATEQAYSGLLQQSSMPGQLNQSSYVPGA